ncbi:MAG: CoA transferase, partial [Dehalococcoidia bacterium]|nr:CoA transferase [Dehalococcoidia bacterium]
GYAPEWLKVLKWEEFSATAATQEQIDAIMVAASLFFAIKTKVELFAAAVEKGCMFAPINTPRDVFADPQLKYREFWTELDHEELGARIPYPGAPCKLSVTPWRLRRRAPLIGEHNRDIYMEELGLSENDLCRLKGEGVI